MNLLKGLLKALRLHKNKSSSQLLKCILLNTALELSTYADQSFSPELFGCIQFEPNHWLNFYTDINTFARMPNPSHQLLPCLPKPSCLVQQYFENQTDNNKSSEDVPSTVKSSSIPLHETDWLESSSVAGTPQKPCIASELGTPNGNTPAKESMVCCRNWSPLTLQIRILQNDECSPHSTLVFDSSTPPKKNILNCDRCSSSTTKSSCSTVQLNLTNTKTHCDTGMQVQDLKVLDANYPDKHLSRSIGCPVPQDCVDRGVQTDPPSQQLLSRSSSSEQEKDQSLCGTFQQDYIDAKQSILWDSYDLHLSRSLINGSPSPQIPDWTLSEHGELCGIEKRASDAESNLKVGKTRKMQHEFENQSFIKPYPRNVYKTPTSQKLCRRAVGMGLFSSTPNRKDLKLRRKWNLKKSAAQISFPHSIKEETYLIDETNGLLEYSDFSYRQTMENNLTRMCV